MHYDYFPYAGIPCARPAAIAPLEPLSSSSYPRYRETRQIAHPLGDHLAVNQVPRLPLDNELTRIRDLIGKLGERCKSFLEKIRSALEKLKDHIEIRELREMFGNLLLLDDIKLENLLKIIVLTEPSPHKMEDGSAVLHHNYNTNPYDYDIFEPLKSEPEGAQRGVLSADYSKFARNIDITEPDKVLRPGVSEESVLHKDYTTVKPLSFEDLLSKYKQIYRELYYKSYLPYRNICMILSKVLYKYVPLAKPEKPEPRQTFDELLEAIPRPSLIQEQEPIFPLQQLGPFPLQLGEIDEIMQDIPLIDASELLPEEEQYAPPPPEDHDVLDATNIPLIDVPLPQGDDDDL